MKATKRMSLGLLLAALLLLGSASVAGAASQPPVNLGSTASFGVLGYSVANTGTTSITGDFGCYNPLYGDPVSVTGKRYVGSQLTTAFADMHKAFDDAWSRSRDVTITADLGGQTLLPGVYETRRGSPIELNGVLTLDAKGDPDAVFIFRTTGGFGVGPNSSVRLINGARFCRVFWVANIGFVSANSSLTGHLIASDYIVMETGAKMNGQLLAGFDEEGAQRAVALYNNVVVNEICTPRLPKTGYPPESQSFPWPAPVGILAASLLLVNVLRRRTAPGRRG